jgi:uncharacterized delta-60 repeat protein
MLLLILFVFPFISFAQLATLDLTFGKGGKVLTKIDSSTESVAAIAIQSDSKILLAGTTLPSVFEGEFLIVRYNTDGSPDKTFGKNGKVITDFNNHNDIAATCVIQSNGKILIVGSTVNPANSYQADFAIARYKTDGSLDSSFGVFGKLIIDFDNRSDYASSVALQGDDKIVISGYTSLENGIESHMALVRLNSNGNVDSSFGINGKIINADFNNDSNFNIQVAIQSDGKILISGTTGYSYQGNSDFLLVRYSAQGVLDSSFGNSGKVSTDFSGYQDFCSAIQIQNDGKIILAGSTSANVSALSNFGLTRYNSDGTLDLSFGKNGKVTTGYSNQIENGIAMTIQDDNKILVTGQDLVNSVYYSILVRYTEGGQLDNTFGLQGRVRNFPGSASYAIAIQPDKKIITGGIFGAATSNSDILVVRYNNEIVLPITLSSFTATKKQNSVLLSWQIASETNNNYFSIERSSNSSNGFKEIARANSKGNSSQTQKYNFEDLTPLKGANYYRLKQVNKDASSTTSKIVFIDFTKDAIIKLYPNPVKNTINIDGLSGTTTLSIIDINGKVVATIKISNNTYNWNIRALPSGNYYLRIDADKKITTIKFVKE